MPEVQSIETPINVFMFLGALTLEHCWFHFGIHCGIILGPLYSSGGLWAWILALFCCTLFSVDFLMDFGIQLGGWGGWVPRGGGGFPPLCFVTFYLKSELTPCVFEVFWISGFPVPVRERLPEGNLPLSEVPPSEYLTECRRIREFSSGEFKDW